MKKLYVGNLSEATTENAIHTMFAEFGTVERVTIVTDRKGRSRGFGFVEMNNDAEADKAMLALHARDFAGRKLQVELAHPHWNEATRTRVLRYESGEQMESSPQTRHAAWSRGILIAQKNARP